jgi:hypothetical protein
VTVELTARLAAVASSQLPNAAVIGDGITVGDIREVMRLLADREGWVRTANIRLKELDQAQRVARSLAGAFLRHELEDFPDALRAYDTALAYPEVKP